MNCDTAAEIKITIEHERKVVRLPVENSSTKNNTDV